MSKHSILNVFQKNNFKLLRKKIISFQKYFYNKSKVINFIFSIVFSIPLIIFLFNSNFVRNINTITSNELTQVSGCGIEINYDENLNVNITNFPKDIYIFPDIENIKCLGVPNEANYLLDGETLNVEYKVGSNYKLFRYSSNLGNYLLILLLLINKKKRLIYLVIIYFAFNIGIYKLFIPTEAISEVFFPVAPIYSTERYIKFFVNNLFLIVLSLKINRNKVYLALFTFFCLFSVDFIGIFVFLLFFKNKFNFNFNDNEKKYFLALPVGFYFLIIISGIFTYLDDVWVSLGQTIYRGDTRYPDMQRTLFPLKCNGDPNATITDGYFIGLPCTNLGGGPLDAYLTFSGNVNTGSKIIGSLSILLLILLYLKTLKYFKENQVLISIFFLSPPIIYLVRYGNPDIVILLICLYSLWNIKQNTFFKLILILLSALFKLHPTSILLGILVVSIKKSDYKIFFNTLGLLIIFTGLFFYDIMNNDHHIATMKWGDHGFGIFLDVINLKASFSIEYLFGFLIILVIISTILFSKSFKELFDSVKFEKMYSSDKELGEYAILSISFWYVITFLYSNVNYRLPAFIVLFLLMYLTNGNKVKGLIIGLLFLEPVILHSELLVRNIFLTINNISHYVIFLICAKYIFTYSIKQFKKLIIDFRNNNLRYQDI